MSTIRLALLAPFVCFVLALQNGQAPPSSKPAAAPKGTVTPEELRDLVEKLASDELQGRGSGSTGGRKAGEFLAQQLEARGVKPLGKDGTWFQPFGSDGSSFRNVAGIVKGTDAARAGEYVVIGAHYDHCGLGEVPGAMGNQAEIHHGADDNASGTAGVLAVARMVAAKPLPRSVVFLLFDAEERGLLGSQHYCGAPLVPIEKTVGMVNLDMIGRSYDGYVFVGGLGSSPAWDDILAKALKGESALLRNPERDSGGTGPSDHDSFYRKDVPVLFFFTNVHRDYHQPRDVAEKIQYKPMAAIARASHEVVKQLASAKTRPPFTKAGGSGLPKNFSQLNAAIFQRSVALARRLGGKIEPSGDGAPRFADVQPAGSRAGIEKGDVIVSIARSASKDAKGFRPVKSVEELRVETEKASPGDPVQLRIRRAEKELVISTTIGDVPEWKHGPSNDAGDLPRPKAK